MKKLTKKNITKLKKENYIYLICIPKQLWGLPEAIKEIMMGLLNIFIFVSCYYIICTYYFSNDNCESIAACTDFLEPKLVDQPKIWYICIVDDFFNKFTSNSRTINPDYMKIKSYNVVKAFMPLEHNLDIIKKPVILNKIQSDYMNNITSECEFYKNKTSLLEIQLLNTKIAYHNLVKDLNDIVKEMYHSPVILKNLRP